MINILYISLTEQVSGGEISILHYISALDKTQYSPLLLCPRSGMLSERAKEYGIPVVFHQLPLLSKKNPCAYIKALFWLIHFIKDKKINIVHGMSFYTCQIAGPVGKLTGIPILIHGQNILSGSKEFFRNLLFLASRIIVCSDAVAHGLLPLIKQDKVRLLRHAISLPASLPRKSFFLHKELKLPKKTTLIGHIGLLEERKCQDIFIAAAQQVLKKHDNKVNNTTDNIVFLVIGDALFATQAYKQQLHALRDKLQLQKHVLFLGQRKDILKILPELDIVVLPSLNEPLAMVTIEACSFAKPYIGAYTGGTSEIIQHKQNGLLVQPKNVEELSTAICYLLEHPKEAQQMGRNAQKTINKHCNLTKNKNILSEIYSSL